MPLAEDSKPLTAFTDYGRGLFEFNAMPFGLHSAPSTFQWHLDRVITPDMARHAFAHLDDIVICTATYEKHLDVLEAVFQKLRNARLRPNPEKRKFFRAELKYLGHIVDQHGLRTDPSKVAATKDLTPPRNLKKAHQFLGLVSWC